MHWRLGAADTRKKKLGFYVYFFRVLYVLFRVYDTMSNAQYSAYLVKEYCSKS